MSVAWVGAGASVLGGILGSNASKDASNAQVQSGREANAINQNQFDQTRADNAGIRARGDAAGSQLQRLLGLPGSGAPSLSRDQIRAQLAAGFTKPGAPADLGTYGITSGGGDRDSFTNYGWSNAGAASPSVVDESGLNTAIDAQLAQQTQQQSQQSSDPSYGSLSRDFNSSDMQADPLYQQLAPSMAASSARSEADVQRAGDFSNSINHRFGINDFEKDPGYQFRMDEGAKGLENSAASRGGLLSGAAMKAIQKYGQDFASNEYSKSADRFNTDRSFATNEYGNAFNRNNTNRNFQSSQGDAAYNRFQGNGTTKYNRLAGIAGSGQQAGQFVNSQGAQFAQNASNNVTGMGNAQASGIVGGANALSGGLNGAYKGYQNNQLMDLIAKRNSGWGSSGGWQGGGRIVPDFPGAEY